MQQLDEEGCDVKMRYQVEKKELKPIVVACKKLLQIREAEKAARVARDAAIVTWWKDSVVPKSGASEAITTVLREEGWSEEDIASVGVSVASTIAILAVVPAYPAEGKTSALAGSRVES